MVKKEKNAMSVRDGVFEQLIFTYRKASWFCRSVLGGGSCSSCRTFAGDQYAGAILRSWPSGPAAGEGQTPIRQPCAPSSIKVVCW